MQTRIIRKRKQMKKERNLKVSMMISYVFATGENNWETCRSEQQMCKTSMKLFLIVVLLFIAVTGM